MSSINNLEHELVPLHFIVSRNIDITCSECKKKFSKSEFEIGNSEKLVCQYCNKKIDDTPYQKYRSVKEFFCKEIETVIEKAFDIKKEAFPKIRKTDPVIRLIDMALLSKKFGELEHGRLIKIVRKSKTAGVSVTYRVIIKGD